MQPATASMMDGTEEAMARRMEKMSYRQLQQMAKSLALPSNFKKIYLVQLIIAKKFKTENEIESIISRVLEERRYQSEVKKRLKEKKSKVTDFNQKRFTRHSFGYSPSITETPKHSSNIDDELSPILRQALTSVNPKRNILRDISKDHNANTILAKTNVKTERSLHSYNLRTPKPSFAPINDIKDENFSNMDTKIKHVASKTVQQFNFQTKCYVHKKSMNSRSVLKQEFVIARSGEFTQNTKPATRERTLSGISPLPTKHPRPLNLATNDVVRFRHVDGSYTKINAVVTKNSNMPKKTYSSRVQKINIQDIMDCMDKGPQDGVNGAKNDSYNLRTDRPNAGLNKIKQSGQSSSTQSAQYRDSFRAEQLKCPEQLRCYEEMIPTPPRDNRVVQQRYPKLPDCRVQLPRFSEAFRNGYTRDLTQPLAQVGSKADNVPKNTVYGDHNNNKLVDSLYNIKTPQPLSTKQTLSIPTRTVETPCTYSIQTILTAMISTTKTVSSIDALNVTPCAPPDNYQYRNNVETLITDYLQPVQVSVQSTLQSTDITTSVPPDNYQLQCEVEKLITEFLEPPQSSCGQTAEVTPDVMQDSYQYDFDVETSITDYLQLQPLQTNCEESTGFNPYDDETSARMDDLMEMISQDGDYMERMGVATPVQCVLCSWSGPVLMLETHVRQKHTDAIHRQSKSEWYITYTLESLVLCKVWLHKVIEHDSSFYMLSVKFEEPRFLVVTLSTISVYAEPAGQAERVSITLYNRITGEPFSGTSQITPAEALNTTAPNSDNCFRVDLAKLDLLPDNTSSLLFNGGFSESPTNVTDLAFLNDIHVMVLVKVYNSPNTM